MHISLRGPSDPPFDRSAAVRANREQARVELLYNLSPHALSALREVWSLLRGSHNSPLAPLELATATSEAIALERMLSEELAAEQLDLTLVQPFSDSLREHEEDEPASSLRALPEPEQDKSFIAVRLLDPKGKPITGRDWTIELPDGSQHHGETDDDGWARVRGFTQDGNAKVMFPEFDEVDFQTKRAIGQIVIPIDGEEKKPKTGSASTQNADADLKKLDAGAVVPPPEEETEPATFTLIVLDDVGAPVPDVNVTIELPSGAQALTTDASGTVSVENVVGPAKAAFDDIEQVRKVLRPRFLAAREPQAFDDANAVVRPLSQLVDAVALTPDVPITLLLSVSIECHEIPGANFEFGRSYVRSSAVEQLATIAEALRNTTDVQAMIFGHTDLSGAEALNKELSERRARAVHALLTHDSKAWEELFSGTADGANWQEKWDIEETQNMLNALGCSDDTGAPLTENGKRDEPTKQAIHRFQRADYPDRPAEQRPVPESDFLGKDGRRLLFLAYAKRISRQPIAPDRFLDINGSPFMGCGEFNALSLSAKDEASRRVNVFLFDPVTAPEQLPCKLRKLPPCQANLDPKPTALDANGRAPFRCRVFQGLASKCTSAPSPDLSHDLVLRFPLQLTNANQLAHKYTLEADDGTITMERTLADDARANDDTLAELSFEHLPELHRYRLMCDDGEQAPYVVFDFATLKELQDRFRSDLVADDLALSDDFAQFVTASVEPIGDEDGSNLRDDGSDPTDDEGDDQPDNVASSDEDPSTTGIV